MGPFTHRALAVLRSLLLPEALPEGPPATSTPRPPEPGAATLLRWLLAPDPLPPELPPLPRRRGRWLAWLFAAEPLDP
jgi:hypothetical protein